MNMDETPYKVTERRPINARQWKSTQQIAQWLARQGVSPNGISVAGMLCGIGAGVALASTSLLPDWERLGWILGAILMQGRLQANMFDGMVAIERNQASPVGELYNEVPDRISDAAILIGAGYAAGGHVALGYTAACVALFVAYVRAIGKAAGAPNDFCGPMAKQHRMAVLTVVALYCGLTPTAWHPTWSNVPIWGSVAPWGIPAVALKVIILGGIVTAIRRLLRIAANLRETRP